MEKQWTKPLEEELLGSILSPCPPRLEAEYRQLAEKLDATSEESLRHLLDMVYKMGCKDGIKLMEALIN